jgi:hypothetical protein
MQWLAKLQLVNIEAATGRERRGASKKGAGWRRLG